MAMAGMDPMRFLETEDPVEAMTMAAIAKRWFERRGDLDDQLASKVINLLAQSMKG